MKKLIAMLFAALIYCGPAAAQGPTNAVDALLGPTGPVQGLVQSLGAGNLQPLVNGLVSDTGLIQGDIVDPLNATLSALLVQNDPNGSVIGLQATLAATQNAATNAGISPAALSGQANGLDPGTGALTLPGL